MIGCSWVIVQRWWVTTAVSLMVLVWWVLFLGLVPAAYRRDCENGQHGGTI
jgi:membrane protein YdbS with pleckstrin-like domain